MKISNKLLIIRILNILILSYISPNASAQIFNSEQNPLSVKWRQINASGFKIIYPQELEKEAQRMANTLIYIYPHVGASLGRTKTQIPIVLQNRGVIANGFVQLAPKKSEFFTTPPQQFDSQDWLNNLAVHELRHVAQFDKLTGGKAHPFPEDVYFAWFGVSIPLWAFEGDAVTIETALTKAGRGKQPSWIMPYRTNLLEGEKFSYSKVNFGSQKDITPGYYQLGYLMTSNMKTEFGKGIIDSILGDIRKRPVRLYPFSNSVKKFTGIGTKKWFNKTTKLLTDSWGSQNEETKSEDYTSLNKTSKYATNYFMPVRLPDGRILALKQSKAETAYFVTIDNQKNESRLFGIAYQEQPWFSFSSNKIAWDEIRYDPRYRQRSYSVICTYDFDKKKVNTITHKSRIFSPSLSPDGKKIVAVMIDLSNKSNLVVLDAKTGKLLQSINNPQNLILQSPSFDKTGKLITYLGVSEQGKALWITDGGSRNEKLLGESQQQLGRPTFTSRGIAFNAHYSGIDNIYELDTASNKMSALSAAKYGAFNPSILDSTMLFNNYQVDGYKIAQAATYSKEIASNHFVNFNDTTRSQENSPDVFTNVPNISYNSKPYHSLGNLFNVHSIIPTIENEYRGGLQLVSNNLLNTFDYFAGVDYLRDLNRVEYNTGFTFKALYPILTTTFRNRPRRTFYTQNKVTKQGDWRENNVQLQASVPLSFNSLNDYYNFSVNAVTSYTQRYMAENLPSTFIKTLNFPMQYSMAFSHTKRQADRDIAPKWAQVVRLTYLHQPFDNKLIGGLFAAEGYLYFPGLAKNHSFLANFNWQNSWGVRRFDQEINTVYGYNNILAKSKLKNTLLFNYRFPIAFPDAELGPIAYIKNLRASLFCHYENIGTETNLAEPKTYGFELRSNMNLLRYQPDVELGGRCVFVNKAYNQNPIFELILNYTF
ncbi:TolB family protein [Pedobacter sp. PWIIR3]